MCVWPGMQGRTAGEHTMVLGTPDLREREKWMSAIHAVIVRKQVLTLLRLTVCVCVSGLRCRFGESLHCFEVVWGLCVGLTWDLARELPGLSCGGRRHNDEPGVRVQGLGLSFRIVGLGLSGSVSRTRFRSVASQSNAGIRSFGVVSRRSRT